MRAPVLLLQHGLGALDYANPDGFPPGTVVEVPLGPRKVVGVVWDPAVFPSRPVDPAKLRPIGTALDMPPLDRPLRELIAWVADYYLAPPAAVLRMALPQAGLLPAPVPKRHYRLGTLPDSATVRLPSRRALLERLLDLREGGSMPLAIWAAAAETGVGTLRALVKAGVLVEAQPPQQALPGKAIARAGHWLAPVLNPSQQAAVARLQTPVRAGGFEPFLLDGVTGSGKTEVYLEAVAFALDAGLQALVLLPEIALTDSWLKRFRARFGFDPAVWHSGLTPAARRTAYRAIASGEAPVVVGARSALFLPIASLGLIIVDEAHDGAFKQEDGVPYHGRDVAVMRAKFGDIPVILATATPSLETREQVARGTYTVLNLPTRHGGATMPDIRLIDLTKTPPPRGAWLAPPLVDAITDRLGRGEQSLLFLNRRGYAPLTLCRACGERIQCPNCTAWLVEHRLARRLQCHHCGHTVPTPRECPACGAVESLAPCGPGVERLAEEVAARWPQARTLVVTSDTMRTPADAEALASAVDGGEIDILIGTQMLTKGHDFKGLTLVGVVDADLGLEGGDLRAAERSYQQIAQVAGRAGRGSKPGEVLIQTHQPRARVMQALATQDSEGFHAAEREARLALSMPPFGRLAALIVSSLDAAAASDAARRLAAAAPRLEGIDVFGPAPAPLAMLRGRHRHRLLVHAKRSAPLQSYVRNWLEPLHFPNSVRITVDVDPQSFV